MRESGVLLWDIGGVLLSNGWDGPDRAAAARRFGFDTAEFDRRHHDALPAYERGEMTLDGYLDRTLFYEPRSFSKAAVTEYMLRCSTPRPEVLAIARQFADSPGWFLAAFNNEGRELNEHRIRTFGLDRLLRAFFSSCYLRLRKPEPAAYQMVRDMLGRPAEEIIFIDDRPENLDPARALGMRAIHFQTPSGLVSDLAAAGVHG